MTIGNLSSKICRMPSMHSVVMAALLPIPIKNCNSPQKWLDGQWQTRREALNDVLRQVLQHLTFKKTLAAKSGYYSFLCADGNFGCCKPVLRAWCADCPLSSDPHHFERHISFWCECSTNKHGEYVDPDKLHQRRDHNQYQPLSNANTKAANTELSLPKVHRRCNIFQHIPHTVSDIPMPNLLYTIRISMLDHHQKWIFHFMKTHERLDKYNAIWLFRPACHDVTP